LQGADSAGLRHQILSVFQKYDQDQSGSIDTHEFAQLCYDLGHPMTPAELSVTMLNLDKNGDGQLDFEEFFSFYSSSNKFHKLKAAKIEALKGFIALFRKYDLDGNGTIDKKGFNYIFPLLTWPEWLKLWREIHGIKGSIKKSEFQACKKSMFEADLDGDGTVSLDEYLNYMIDLGVLWVNQHDGRSVLSWTTMYLQHKRR